MTLLWRIFCVLSTKVVTMHCKLKLYITGVWSEWRSLRSVMTHVTSNRASPLLPTYIFFSSSLWWEFSDTKKLRQTSKSYFNTWTTPSPLFLFWPPFSTSGMRPWLRASYKKIRWCLHESHTHAERERERALEPEYINAGGYLYTHHSCIGLRTLHVH